MKIEISQQEVGQRTSLKVNGIELANNATAFSLTQRAGEVPMLTVEIPLIDELDISLPDGIVIVEKLPAEE